MRYRFFTCDVFTDRRFGGNQLAVLPQASGLSDSQMQAIAREFNYSETTFVFPSQRGFTRHVRIFTPKAEVPFAGHPNIGTAFVLATTGELGDDAATTVSFEEKAGPVHVRILRRGDGCWCQLSAPEQLSLGRNVDPQLIARSASLRPDDIIVSTHPPQLASVGLPFIFAEVRGRDALARASVNMDGFAELATLGVPPDVHLYTLANDDFDIRARMFAPFDGVLEDPATGSANCALAGLLSHHAAVSDGTLAWRIAQGQEMGRPSVLSAEADKRDGVVVATRIAGDSVLVSEGHINV